MNTPRLSGILLCDIDGTLTIIGDRKKYAQKDTPDWDSFHKFWNTDFPNWSVIRMVRFLEQSYQLVFCTGRPERYRSGTVDWLTGAGLSRNHPLLMRPPGNVEPNVVLKPLLLLSAGISREQVSIIVEDNRQMVDEWRRLGYICLQVNEGLV